MGIVLKSINSINYSISIAYDQNTLNNIYVNIYICKVSWNGGVLLNELSLNNANKSNIVNLSLSMGEKIFISIDTVIDSDFIFEIMSI